MVLTLESIARGHSTPTSSSRPWRTETTTQLGWAFVVGAALGVVLEVVGVGIPGFVYLGTAALGVAIWRHGPTPPQTSTTS